MPRHWYRLSEGADRFLNFAPFRFVNSVDVSEPPEKIWRILATGTQLVSWTPVFTGLKWVTPPPFGSGTVREVTLLRILTARERFFRWEEGQRQSYAVFEASLPGLRRAVEDYVITPTPSGSRLTWTLAVEPLRPLTPLVWMSSPIIRRTQRRVLDAIRTHAES